MAFSGFADFNPNFGSALQRFIAANPGISIGSGYRDIARQTQLWNAALQKYGSEAAARHWVAPPGHSRHNAGLAADLQFRDDAARQWAHENAARYGLNFRMGHEPWHIELAGDGGGAGAGAGEVVANSSDAPLGDTLAGAVKSPLRSGLDDLAASASRTLAGGDTGGQPQITETRGDTGVSLPPPQFEQASLAAEDLSKRKQALKPSISPLADLFNVKAIGQAGVPMAASPIRRV